MQPMLAAAALLRGARRPARRPRCSPGSPDGRRGPCGDGRGSPASRTDRGVAAAAVVNAAGTWAGEVAALAGVDACRCCPGAASSSSPSRCRALIRHKVYAADYVADVASDAAALQTSAVVEGTRPAPS